MDSKSCKNVISQDAVDKLKFSCENYPVTYKLSLFKKGNEVIVILCALVPFFMWGKYHDNIWWDINAERRRYVGQVR